MKRFRKTVVIFMTGMGVVFTLSLILAFTSAPFWMWYALSVSQAGVNRPPDYIVVLGGGGMPSESGLIRCWYGAKTATYFTHARVIVALPGDVRDSMSSVNGMRKELLIRGIQKERILMEDSGANTRAEALNVLRIVETECRHGIPAGAGGNRETAVRKSILVVSSPEHICRAVLAFRKAGFIKVDGLPAFEATIESDITFLGRKLGGRSWIPDIGNSITLRYQFWTQLGYEELLMRELVALGYYKLKGWI
jgi:uncharacterized SAM-binding protein YcdF (DUF218 family)